MPIKIDELGEMARRYKKEEISLSKFCELLNESLSAKEQELVEVKRELDLTKEALSISQIVEKGTVSYNAALQQQLSLSQQRSQELHQGLKELLLWYNECAGNLFKNYDIAEKSQELLNKG